MGAAAPRGLSTSLRGPAGVPPPPAGDGWLRFPFPPSEAEYHFIKITEGTTGVSLGKEMIPGKRNDPGENKAVPKQCLCREEVRSHQQPCPAFRVGDAGFFSEQGFNFTCKSSRRTAERVPAADTTPVPPNHKPQGGKKPSPLSCPFRRCRAFCWRNRWWR